MSDAKSSPKALSARVSAICSPPGTAGESPVSAGSTAVPRVRMARTGIKARHDHVTIRVARLRSECDRGALPDICGYLSRNQSDIGAPMAVLPTVSHCPLSYGKIKALPSFFQDSSRPELHESPKRCNAAACDGHLVQRLCCKHKRLPDECVE